MKKSEQQPSEKKNNELTYRFEVRSKTELRGFAVVILKVVCDDQKLEKKVIEDFEKAIKTASRGVWA